VLALASHIVAVGTTEYATDFVRAGIRLRETLAGGVRVLQGIPLLIGGTSNMAALRTMEEINQWVTSTSGVKNNISSTRALWATLISTRSICTESTHTIRLPVSMHKLEMGTFIGGGYSYLTAVAPLSEENKHSLVLCLISKLNKMFATGLCVDPIVDWYLDEDVFEADSATRPIMILVGLSHLNRIADQLDANKWEVINLSMGGFRPNEDSIAEMTSRIEEIKKEGCLENCTFVIQLLDNSVSGWGTWWHLTPASCRQARQIPRGWTSPGCRQGRCARPSESVDPFDKIHGGGQEAISVSAGQVLAKTVLLR
jgi:hypothetical protein